MTVGQHCRPGRVKASGIRGTCPRGAVRASGGALAIERARPGGGAGIERARALC
jgi:hypothetical protein